MARPPKPTAAHKRDGTFRADRHGDRVDASFPTGLPVKPHDLPPESEWLWNHLVENMPAEQIALIDRTAMESACIWYAHWKRFDALLMQSPDPEIFKMASQSWGRLEKLFSKFGMSPLDRARLRAPAKKESEEDALSQLKLVSAKGA